jgi:glycosyltransferase involved in cell wall biosynthesis
VTDRRDGTLSVVLPLYRTRASVPELVDRLLPAVASLGLRAELVFVDDACPERSHEAARSHPAPDANVVILRHDRNRGQHAAVLSGLGAATGGMVATMDADLQDAPEDLPRLVERLLATGCDAVAAGRRGRYEKVSRRLTARLFRWSVSRLTAGRIPGDAAMFLVMTSAARDRVLGLGDPGVHLVAALGRVGARMESVPVERRRRAQGDSSYPSWRRAAVAARALLVLTPLYPVVRRVDAIRRGT